MGAESGAVGVQRPTINNRPTPASRRGNDSAKSRTATPGSGVSANCRTIPSTKVPSAGSRTAPWTKMLIPSVRRRSAYARRRSSARLSCGSATSWVTYEDRYPRPAISARATIRVGLTRTRQRRALIEYRPPWQLSVYLHLIAISWRGQGGVTMGAARWTDRLPGAHTGVGDEAGGLLDRRASSDQGPAPTISRKRRLISIAKSVRASEAMLQKP